MTGQSPFPGVGNVDGLHPSPESAGEKDELKRKEKLRRAGLNAKFTKGAWHVYEADKLVLTASVKDIAGEFSEPLYKSIATKEFGSDLLKRIELDGVEKVVATFKGAQLAPAAPAAPAEAPAAAPSMEASKSEDKGGSGDPSEQIPELLDQLEGLVPDLRKGFDTLTGQSENVPGFEDLGKVAPESFSPAVAAAFVEQKKLYSHLTNGLKNTISKAEFAYNEMKLANDICKPSYKFAAKDAQLQGLVSEAVHNARVAVSDAYRIMDVFVKYHEGTKNVMKKAAKELAFVKKAQTSSGDPLDPMNPDLNVSKPVAPAAPVAPPAPAPTSAPHKLPSEKTMEELMKDRGTLREQTVEDMLRDNVQNGQYAPKNIAPSGPGGLVPQADANQAKDSSSESSMSESSASSASSDSADLKMNPDGSLDGSPEEVGKAMKEMPKKADFDLTTVEGRNAYRAKLAQKAGVKFDPMLDQAHGKGGAVPPSINQNKPSGDLGKVETLEEVKKKMLEAVSGKAKKAAEDIQRLVLAGEIKASEVDGLVSLGVDKDAVSYWKAMWGEAKDKESKEFASELLKEHYEAKVAKEVETYKVKLARSYDLSYEMVRKGAIPNTRTAIAKSVDELSRLDDSGFDTLKKTIEGIPAKEASILPRVGMGEEQVILPKVASHAEADLAAEFNAALNTPRRGFRG